LHRVPNFSRDTSQSLWRTATDKVVYRAGDYITRTISDKAKNESILLQAQLESSKQKAQKLNSELEQEKNQKAKHMKEVEKKNATLKLTVKMLEEKFNLAEKSKQGEIDKVKNQMQEDQQNFDSQIDELKADYDRVRQENDILRTEKRALEGNSSIIIYS
jgi:small-conductance mechanosensitive channel